MRSLRWVIGAMALATAQTAMTQIAAAQPNNAASVSAAGTATVVQPITLLKGSDLAFGALVRPTLGSNIVTVDANSGQRSITGGGDGALAPSLASSRATYAVGGEGGAAFSITVPGSFTMTRAGGGETLPVTLSASTLSGALSGSVGTAGAANFSVGGSLPMSSATVSGDYTGTFDVTVGYN